MKPLSHRQNLRVPRPTLPPRLAQEHKCKLTSFINEHLGCTFTVVFSGESSAWLELRAVAQRALWPRGACSHRDGSKCQQGRQCGRIHEFYSDRNSL
jgi:hypothetical protein